MPARDAKDKPVKRRARKGFGGIAADKLPDLSALSEQELTALSGLVERELVARREQKRKDFFATMRSQAEALGVAPEELAAELGRKQARGNGGRAATERRPERSMERGSSDRRATVAPKYRNPNDPAQTWAGRGVKPRWMQALLAQGQSMEDFRIDQR